MISRVAGVCKGLLAATTMGVWLCGTPAWAEGYQLDLLVPGHGFNGIHGLTFDEKDQLYVGSVVGQSIYLVDTKTGDAQTYIGLPEGMADDLEFGADGTLAWTSFNLGIVHSKKGAEPIRVLASGLPGINSLAFKEDGRLFATQVFLGDALYEIDLKGEAEPRKILEGMGGLNGFDFGPDGLLYGPLWFKGQVAKVDVDTGELTVVAEGFEIPAAANFDSKGNLYVLDTAAGVIYRVDIQSGEKTQIAKLKTAMDNLAFDSKDGLYVTVMADNAIYAVDTETGTSRLVKGGKLGIPCDIDVYNDEGPDSLYVADLFALRKVNALSRLVEDLARNYADELENPIGISVNRDHILASSWFTNTVQLLDRQTGESILIAHDFAAPADAIELENGDWAVLELGSGRLVRASGPEKTERTTIAEGLSGGVALAPTEDGYVYVSRGAAGSIEKVNLETGEVENVITGLSLPEGLDTDPEGKLVVAEVGKERLIRIDPASGDIEEIIGGLTIGLPAPPNGTPASYTPTGVAVSISGTIYVASDIEDAIYRVRAN